MVKFCLLYYSFACHTEVCQAGANVINVFTLVIYCHSIVILSFFVKELYYLGNYHRMAVNFPTLDPGANVINVFTAVIYCHFIVILSFCVKELYYLGNYHGMAVNYHGKAFYNIGACW